ncbi:MAG: DUF167 domain-containing protein [Fibrobacterales bacterium]
MKISVKAQTKSKRNDVLGPDESGLYTVHVNTPPVDGKANTAICALLAKHFKVSKSSVSVLKGQTSKQKIIEIEI